MNPVVASKASKEKLSGSVYTPPFLAEMILDLTEYKSAILEKHVMDNSCGDGAFLTAIVRRYCRAFLKKSDDKNLLKKHLATYIHGIDNDSSAVEACVRNLDSVAASFGADGVAWDVFCADTLTVRQYDGAMDFVVGNPPYIRIHNLNDSYEAVKDFSFAANGMTDLYIVFFEIGFRMLNPKGKMGLITPSSFLRSKAGTNLRRFIQERRTLSKVLDLGHFQPFKAMTYTMITVFDAAESLESVEYFALNADNAKPAFVEKLAYDDILIGEKLYFSASKNLKILRQIEEHFSRRGKREVVVKNGFATLADDVFIGDFDFSDGAIDVVKASTGKWRKCVFPYHPDGTPMTWKEFSRFKKAAEYLESKKSLLLKRDVEKNSDWFLFGRTQALRDVSVCKLSVNTMIKNEKSLKIFKVEKGQGIYSGLYILSKYSEKKIREVLISAEFIEYLRLLKNYKSGGYYTFSSLEIEKYLCYKLEETSYGQLGFFENSG
ncbi:MAG: N-6 DNA methylase [Anaerolineales bacterium]|nr:N-6 DNA methylase [Anaerolineales bacterium]